MQLVVDALIAAIIVINTVLGYRRGFVKTVFRLCTVIVSVILACLFGSTVGSLMRETPVYENLEKSTEEKLEAYFIETAQNGMEDVNGSLEKNSFVETAQAMGIDVDKMLEDFSLHSEQEAKTAAKEMSRNVAKPTLKALSNILGTVLVFVASLILCGILSKLLCGICRLPILHGLNSMGGLILGLVLGIAYGFVLCLLIKLVIPCLPPNPVLYAGMEKDTLLYGFLSGINPVYLFLMGKYLI